MSYDALVDRLDETNRSRRIVTLPDGSVDHWYAVDGPDGERLTSRDALGRRLVDDGDAFTLERIAVRPGGQAVNAAQQVHALGDEAVLVGHLDHPKLATFPFETHSMGDPRHVYVLGFDGEEVLLAERRAEDAGWGLADLTAAIDWTRIETADAICCVNWASYRGVTDVVAHLASHSPDDVPLVLDPGPLERADEGVLEDLLAALETAESSVDVVVSVNRAECETIARTFGVADDDLESTLIEVRTALEVSGVVLHGPDVAAAATPDGTCEVPMLSVDEPGFTAGAGDRFSGGLAVALARGWQWNVALALGNACSASFIARNETADAAVLESFLG